MLFDEFTKYFTKKDNVTLLEVVKENMFKVKGRSDCYVRVTTSHN